MSANKRESCFAYLHLFFYPLPPFSESRNVRNNAQQAISAPEHRLSLHLSEPDFQIGAEIFAIHFEHRYIASSIQLRKETARSYLPRFTCLHLMGFCTRLDTEIATSQKYCQLLCTHRQTCLWSISKLRRILVYAQVWSGAWTRGNGVPTSFPNFALKRV